MFTFISLHIDLSSVELFLHVCEFAVTTEFYGKDRLIKERYRLIANKLEVLYHELQFGLFMPFLSRRVAQDASLTSPARREVRFVLTQIAGPQLRKGDPYATQYPGNARLYDPGA